MNFWLAVYKGALIAFVAMAIIAVVCLFKPKFRQNQEYQRTLSTLKEENLDREKEIKRLQAQQNQFLSDPGYVERIAREELGKVREGETVFRFTERKTNTFRLRP